MAEKSSPEKGPLTSRVRDYMSLHPKSLGAEHSLLDAVLMLRRENLRHIPILEDGHLVGIISDRDVARFTPSLLLPLPQEEYNRVFEDTPVRKVMTKNPMHTTPDTLLAEAVELLHLHRLGCLPVLEDGQLVGMITVSDMLRALHDLIASMPSSPDAPPEG